MSGIQAAFRACMVCAFNEPFISERPPLLVDMHSHLQVQDMGETTVPHVKRDRGGQAFMNTGRRRADGGYPAGDNEEKELLA